MKKLKNTGSAQLWEKVLLYLYLIYRYKKQMLQGANTDLFNLLDPKAHNSECT